MFWEFLADMVVAAHLICMAGFLVSAILLALGFFRGRHNWQKFYWGVIIVAIVLRIGEWTGLLKSCSLTDLEYMFRRMYDSSESWMRTKSLLGTIAYDLTGMEVPEIVFGVLGVVIPAVMVASLILHKN
jgi:hypothetical protein